MNSLVMPLTLLPGGQFHMTEQLVSLSGNHLDNVSSLWLPLHHPPHPSLLLSGIAIHLEVIEYKPSVLGHVLCETQAKTSAK